jgi:hypothetical protein
MLINLLKNTEPTGMFVAWAAGVLFGLFDAGTIGHHHRVVELPEYGQDAIGWIEQVLERGRWSCSGHGFLLKRGRRRIRARGVQLVRHL